jgi:y4mF family transcriptional regulator
MADRLNIRDGDQRGSIFEKGESFGVRHPIAARLHPAADARGVIASALEPSAIPPSSNSARKAARASRAKAPTPAPATADNRASSTSVLPSPIHVPTVERLGALVRARRSRLSISQQQLADLAGVGRRFISELEAGKPTLEFDRVVQCCAALGIDILARSRS